MSTRFATKMSVRLNDLLLEEGNDEKEEQQRLSSVTNEKVEEFLERFL